MSSIVSRRAPFSVSTSQAKDFFWWAIRLGTSRTLSRRAKFRRVRGASTAAKTATPQGTRRTAERGARVLPRGIKARPAKIAQGHADPCEGRSALTDPVLPSLVCGEGGVADGCDYRPTRGGSVEGASTATARD